ncbi:hypothetical protein SLEP1_g29065 [Rubroshorea leprosula]|uniref:Wax synthase domain-containing protein n=1 Tax=Rubroshorea leprosula TaxID=152421 RepID=A0AAV5JVQ8_9ROSI|nr:hypothetical protein SLEP1_g29065 [Rubroshorea leprosula]
MEGEMYNLMKVWIWVLISLCYCYVLGKATPKGTRRLLCLLPIVCLFLYLPLNLSSLHLGGISAFFIAWLANFKLLLFAYGKGPLSSSLSLPRFVAVACLPIKIQQNQSPKSHLNGQNPKTPSPQLHQNGQNKEHPNAQNPQKGHKSPSNYAIKILLLAALLRVYDYREFIHHILILVLYSFHIYFALEIILAMVAAIARVVLGLELEQQFNEPYLSTSLQDFWGRRWNIMVSSILRLSVYDPLLRFGTPLIGRKWAPLPAVFGTFVVSGLMHEIIFYYLGRVRPTWEITRLFLLHGFCLMVEIVLKKISTEKDKRRLPRVVSTPLTVGFVLTTGFWLFFPPLLRCRAEERAFQEYAALGAFLNNIRLALISSLQS